MALKFNRYGDQFETVASPEAIAANLAIVEARLARDQAERDWLRGVQKRREGEIADGTWPPKKTEEVP